MSASIQIQTFRRVSVQSPSPRTSFRRLICDIKLLKTGRAQFSRLSASERKAATAKLQEVVLTTRKGMAEWF